MDEIGNRAAAAATLALIDAIAQNRQSLSDIDGLIGDGDHGVNMNKGFQQARRALAPEGETLASSFRKLSDELLEIGGSMGPLYGAIFGAMAELADGQERLGAPRFLAMLTAAETQVRTIGQCQPGEKTLLDVLAPARAAFAEALARGATFSEALDALARAAEAGRAATTDMIATKGRASRLGERSRGVPDPGATSCCLLLTTLAASLQRLLASGR